MSAASVRDGKRPRSSGVFKPVTAYDASASDVQEISRLAYNGCAVEVECESTNAPEPRSKHGGIKYPWSSHGRLVTQVYEAYKTAVECCDIRKAVIPKYIAPLHNLGGVIEIR